MQVCLCEKKKAEEYDDVRRWNDGASLHGNPGSGLIEC